MGVVYNAVQLSTSREVAFKIVKVDVGDDARLDRFKQEVEIISNLSHPNIVRVIDTGTIPNHDLLYVVMELIEGIPLSDLLWHKHAEGQYFKCRTRMEFALEVIYQLCAALTEPHRQGIIHRDIKPENILISPSSDETVQLKVLDFGIARVLNHSKSQKKMTDSRIPFVGTPHYMAPEQVARSQYDARTDLYAVGVVLFEMLSSQYPFDNENLLALLLQKTQRDAPSLSEVLPEDHGLLQDVIALTDALLSRDQDARPADAMKVRRMIEDIRDEHRLRRVRIDIHDFFEQRQNPIPEEERARQNEDEKLEPYRKLYRSWLLYPSGKPLIPGKEEAKPAQVVAEASAEPAELPPVMPAVLTDLPPVMPAFTAPPVVDSSPELPLTPPEAPQLPDPIVPQLGEDSSVADLAQIEVEPVDLAEEVLDSHTDVLQAPKRNKLKAWHVDINWTNSFNVADLDTNQNLDVHEMGELFEEEEEEAEDIDEVVTSIWKPDLSEFPQDLLDSFKSYDSENASSKEAINAQHTSEESEALDSDRLFTDSDASVDLGSVPPGFTSLPGVAKHTPDFGAIPVTLESSSNRLPDDPQSQATAREAETVRERALAGHVIGQESYPAHSDTIPEPFSVKTPEIQEMLAEAKQIRQERAQSEALITTESGLHSLLPEADPSPSTIARVALFDDDPPIPLQPIKEPEVDKGPGAVAEEPAVEPSLEVKVPTQIEEPASEPVPATPVKSSPDSMLDEVSMSAVANDSKLPLLIGVLIVLVIVIGIVIAIA